MSKQVERGVLTLSISDQALGTTPPDRSRGGETPGLIP